MIEGDADSPEGCFEILLEKGRVWARSCDQVEGVSEGFVL